MISFACPHCQAKLRCEEGKAGRSLPCPGCRQLVQVPLPPIIEQDRAGQLVPVASLAPPPAAYPAAIAPAPSSFHCVCRHCQTVVSVDHRWVGTPLACPNCQTPLEIPGAAPPHQAAQPVTVQVFNSAAATSVAAPTQIVATSEPPAFSGCSCLVMGLVLGLLLACGGLAFLGQRGTNESERTRPAAGPPRSEDPLFGLWEEKQTHDQIALSGDRTLKGGNFGGQSMVVEGHWTFEPGQYRNLRFTLRKKGSQAEEQPTWFHAEFNEAGELLLTGADGTTATFFRVK